MKGDLQIEIEAWHPFKNTKPTQKLASKALRFEEEGDKVHSVDPAAPTVEEPPEKRARTAKFNVEDMIGKLGLVRQQNSGGGDCLFHALGQMLATLQKTPTDGAAVRAAVMTELDNRSAQLQSLFCGQGPDDKPVTWKKHLGVMKKPGSWNGEMEILGAALRWGLQIMVMRPNKPTVCIGGGIACVGCCWRTIIMSF